MDEEHKSQENGLSHSDSSAQDSDSQADNSKKEEIPHVHEVVKDVDELIAAMDHVDEGMLEEDEESEKEPSKQKPIGKLPVVEKPQEHSEIRVAKERLAVVKSKLLTLQWDLEHGQINPAKKALYERLKPEYDSLVKLINEPTPQADSKSD